MKCLRNTHAKKRRQSFVYGRAGSLAHGLTVTLNPTAEQRRMLTFSALAHSLLFYIAACSRSNRLSSNLVCQGVPRSVPFPAPPPSPKRQASPGRKNSGFLEIIERVQPLVSCESSIHRLCGPQCIRKLYKTLVKVFVDF